jgi:hypothetical protein
MITTKYMETYRSALLQSQTCSWQGLISGRLSIWRWEYNDHHTHDVLSNEYLQMGAWIRYQKRFLARASANGGEIASPDGS